MRLAKPIQLVLRLVSVNALLGLFQTRESPAIYADQPENKQEPSLHIIPTAVMVVNEFNNPKVFNEGICRGHGLKVC